MIRILVADDEQIEREAVTGLIAQEFPGQCAWVGLAADGDTAVRLAEQERPHIAVLDIRMPGVDGLTVAERLRNAVPTAQVILLTAHADFAYAHQAIRLGVQQYLLKPFPRLELVDALRLAFQRVWDELQPGKSAAIGQLATRLARTMMAEHLLAGRPAYQAALFAECSTVLGLDNPPNTVIVAEWPPAGTNMDSARAIETLFPATLTYAPTPGRLVLLPWLELTQAGDRTAHEMAERLKQHLQETVGREVRVGVGRAQSQTTTLSPAYAAAVATLGSTENRLPAPVDLAVEVMVSQAGLDRTLTRLETAVYAVAGLPHADLIRWGFGLMAACCEQLDRVGCDSADVSQSEAVLSRELLSTENPVQFVAWTEKALTRYHNLSFRSEPGGSREMISKIAAYLDVHYMQDLDLEKVARIFGLSPEHLSRLYKRETGENFSRHLTEVRLRAALDLLTTSTVSVHLISRLVGFRSHSYFCTVFKRWFSVPPSDYRARLQREASRI